MRLRAMDWRRRGSTKFLNSFPFAVYVLDDDTVPSATTIPGFGDQVWLPVTHEHLNAFFGRRRKWDNRMHWKGAYEIPDNGQSDPAPGTHTFDIDSTGTIDVAPTTQNDEMLPHGRTSIFIRPNGSAGSGLGLEIIVRINSRAILSTNDEDASNQVFDLYDDFGGRVVPHILYSRITESYYMRPIAEITWTVPIGLFGFYSFGWKQGPVPVVPTFQEAAAYGGSPITLTNDVSEASPFTMLNVEKPGTLYDFLPVQGYFFWPEDFPITIDEFIFKAAIPASDGFFPHGNDTDGPVWNADTGEQIRTPNLYRA